MITATRPLAGAARFVPVPAAEPWIEPPEEITWTGRLVGGRYAVCERIGGGGMADVYRARDERLQQDVALKVLRSSLASRELRARMLQEARAAAAIEHPHMLRVLDVGEELGTSYIAMELLRGASLSRRLHEVGGRLPWREVVPLLLPAAAALQHAHACGFVHRDIKPDNLWVAERGGAPWIVVLDLGIAKAARARRGADSPPTTELGRALGTPRYMSPEQAAGQAVDARSDVFSFAVTLFRALTGGFPWAARSDGAVVEPRAALQAAELEIPPALSEAIVRALARRPEERLPSMRALAALLDEVVALPVRRRGTTVSWALTGALGGALAVAGARAAGREQLPANVLSETCEQAANVQMLSEVEQVEGAPTWIVGERTEAPDVSTSDVGEWTQASDVSAAAADERMESALVCEPWDGESVSEAAGRALGPAGPPPGRAGKPGLPGVGGPSGRAGKGAAAPAKAPELLEMAGPELRRCYDEFGGAEPVAFRVRMLGGGEGERELTLTPEGSPLGRCVRAGFAALAVPQRGGRWTYEREFRLGPGGVR